LETAEALFEARSLLGPQTDRSRQTWNTEVTKDAVQHFCWGIGDDNPLFCDAEYAGKSVLGNLSAPGTFLTSIDTSIVFAGLAGTPTLHIGTEWTWHDRLWVGDSLTADVAYVDCKEVTGRNAGKMLVQTSEAVYRNQHGKHVGTARSTCARKPACREGGFGYSPREVTYSAEEIEQIQRTAVAERPRGDAIRWWEHTKQGDPAGTIVKGPLSLIDMMCWYAGAGLHGRRAHRLAWKEIECNREHWRRARNGAFEHLGQGHLDAEGGQQCLMPGAYDNGLQRTAWVGHLITDWMGDAGFLKSLTCRILRPNVFGDVTWLSGTVITRRVDVDGDRVVELSVVGRNQFDEETTNGTAVVRLTSLSDCGRQGA
jgi:acyl dehydratase